jgi:hypothetical protein
VRTVAGLLHWDVVLQTHEGKMDAALRSCQGIFNCGRIIGEDPLILAQLIRMAMTRMGLVALERALSQGEADEATLSAIQALLAEEAAHPRLRIVARGERGSVHWVLSAVAAGDLAPARLAPPGQPGPFGQLPAGQAIRPLHAQVLRRMTRWVEITGLPLWEQPALAREWERAQKTAAKGLLSSMPARTCTDSSVRLQAEVHGALAAVAVERYRLAHGSWPRDLGALVPAYLKAIPNDPYEGKPLRYRRVAGGVVVYSLGPDRADNKGNLDRTGQPAEGTDVGFQLWDVAKRRQAPGGGGG